jgi:prephenate dehydrogenase
MAGTKYSGLKHSKASMFKGAPLVIVPPVFDDMKLIDRVKAAVEPAGFGSFCLSHADKHDEMIAFTSQMAHVVSNAYVKSPTAAEHHGFSAGSYKDLTRVAWLNAGMWAELFMENKDNLCHEIDSMINELGKYRAAMEAGDQEKLQQLLQEGSDRKAELDG